MEENVPSGQEHQPVRFPLSQLFYQMRQRIRDPAADLSCVHPAVLPPVQGLFPACRVRGIQHEAFAPGDTLH